jgi:predicted DsbA family dithiol-disulfide isomerase
MQRDRGTTGGLAEGWPLDGLRAMRATTWAKRQSTLVPFAQAGFRQPFAHGRDLSGVDALAAVAEDVGPSGEDLRAAIDCPAGQGQLRAATAHAWELGVRGVPPFASARAVVRRRSARSRRRRLVLVVRPPTATGVSGSGAL